MERRAFTWFLGAVLAALAMTVLVACGGGDDDSGQSTGGATGAGPTSSAPDGPAGAGAAAPGGSTDTTGSTAGNTGPTAGTGTGSTTGASTEGGDELDVCTLITKEEVESAVGQAVGVPSFSSLREQGFTSPGLGGGECRFESDDITSIVSVTVFAWDDEDDAESSFELLDDYPEIDGLGDGAYNTQPLGDVSARSGRYELSVDLFFVSEDDAVDLEAARQLAELVISRLP